MSESHSSAAATDRQYRGTVLQLCSIRYTTLDGIFHDRRDGSTKMGGMHVFVGVWVTVCIPIIMI